VDDRIELLRAAVVAQANSAGPAGWMEIPVPPSVRPAGFLRVPTGAFERWAVRPSGAEHLAAAWTPVCPQGIKQGADDPCHTDWMLGAGLQPGDMLDDADDPPRSRDLGDAAYRARAEVEARLLGFGCSVLLSGPEVRGRVWHPRKPDDLDVPWSEEPPIAVIRDARPDWLGVVVEVLSRGGAVIFERGGEMAHLVTVLRGEGRGPLVRVPGALRLYPEGLLVDVVPGQGRVEVRDDGRLPAEAPGIWETAPAMSAYGSATPSASPAAVPVQGDLVRCGAKHPARNLPFFRSDKNFKVEGPRFLAVASGHSTVGMPVRPGKDRVELLIDVIPRDGKGARFCYYAGLGTWPFPDVKSATLRALDLHDPLPSTEQSAERENDRLRARHDRFMAGLAAMPDAELIAHAKAKAAEEARYRRDVEDGRWDLVDRADIDLDWIEFFDGMGQELGRRGLPEPERARSDEEASGFRP